MTIHDTSLTVTLSAVALLAATVAAPARAQAAETTASGTTTIDLNKHAIEPSPAQVAVVQRVAASELSMCKRIDPDWQREEDCYHVALADLNDDNRPDLVIQISPASRLCGSRGCEGWIVMANGDGDGYAHHAIGLPIAYARINVLPRKHHGMHDLTFHGYSKVWKYDGHRYH